MNTSNKSNNVRNISNISNKSSVVKSKKPKPSSRFQKVVGSRAEVFHGKAFKTSGGLLKKDLRKNKHGRIVSKKASQRAKKEKRLEKAGYIAKKGEFHAFQKGDNKRFTFPVFAKKFN